MSKAILVSHVSLLILFIIFSLSTPFVAMWRPGIFSLPFFLIALIITGGVMVSWQIYNGCPLTVLENRHNKEKAYSGTCINHYATQWFGIGVPRNVSTSILVFLFLLPLVVSLVVQFTNIYG